MRLRELLPYQSIVIQCHDYPDADAIASGFSLYHYFRKNGKKVRLVYSGKQKIQKSNLVLMIEKLEIPIEFVHEMERPQLLITVDCQYGQSNVTKLEGDVIAVIDHHQVNGELPKLNEVRSNLGSCSTLIREMLREEQMDVNQEGILATALYYGHMTDTGNFTEISHPMDKDMRDDLKFDKRLIVMFRNANLSLDELSIAGEALLGYQFVKEDRFAIVEAKPCDPNILGMISDLMLEVDQVDSCVVYSVLPYGIKFSVRSCIVEVNAGEMAQFIAEGIGGGGGHMGKAGGFVEVCDKSEFENRIRRYFNGVDVIYGSSYEFQRENFEAYVKKNIPIGYVKAADLVECGRKVCVRTLEGDLDILVEEDVYVMIGIKGEVYPSNRQKFERSYQLLSDPYVFSGEYEPSIKDNETGEKISLVPYAHSCVATGEVTIYAKELDHRVKVFTEWDKEKYMTGKKGDFLACRKDDLHDVYVIERNIFFKTYEKRE